MWSGGIVQCPQPVEKYHHIEHIRRHVKRCGHVLRKTLMFRMRYLVDDIGLGIDPQLDSKRTNVWHVSQSSYPIVSKNNSVSFGLEGMTSMYGHCGWMIF